MIVIFTVFWLLLWGAATYWAFKGPRKRKILGSIFACLLVFGALGSLATAKPAPKTKTIAIGTHRLAKAKAESRKLAASSSKQATAILALNEADSSSKEAASAASTAKADKASSVAQASRRAASKAAASNTATSHATQTSRSKPKGDLETDKAGTIVGNKNSKIYHTPDQAGYHMNSANAVYFKSEAAAQAGGYRKALR
ncbi:sunset domain-containing protein [Levilactobacillus tongjiangensis]|uniref:DNA-entry nuclease n=1 Tax=Levilactobacillus tongjiangensis TaxID=2486023 RepID=A0ABW1SUL7_9LACO|nr:hypothetical protein [Levilactobacillus tongjiangensis]